MLHKLLVLQTQTSSNPKLEMFRLGAILFIAEIRRQFGVYPVQTRAQVRKLRGIIKKDDVARGDLRPLKVWALVLAGMGAGDEADRVWIVEALLGMGIGLEGVCKEARRLWWLDVFEMGYVELEMHFLEAAVSKLV